MLFYILCVILISFSGAQKFLRYNPSNSYTGIGSRDFAQECKTEFSCVNCTTVRICKRHYLGYFNKILEFQCEGSRPYCEEESGTCVKTTDLIGCNRSTTTDFKCSSDGYYPNPHNCHKYFVCVKGFAYKMDCGSSYYNPKSENCNNQNYCNTISCDKKSGIKVAYESDYSFYGYCYNNTLIGFEKCPGKFQFDVQKQICLPVCSTEGLQGDPYDCTKYYKCSYEYSSTQYSYELKLNQQKCYKKQYFDSVNLRCAELKEGLHCESGLVYLRNGTFVHKDKL